jgi:hypothetical protein
MIRNVLFSTVLLLICNIFSYAQITTVAGNGNSVFSGDGGVATNAGLNSPHEIAVDSQGNLYIADSINYAVRKVDVQTGIITSLIGTGEFDLPQLDQPAQGQSIGEVYGVAVDNGGQVFFGDASCGLILKIDNNGVLRLVVDLINTVSQFTFAMGMTFDSSGRFLYVADAGLNAILKIDTTNSSVSIVAGMGDFTGGFSGDGALATNAMLHFPIDVAIDSQGNLFVADSDNNRVRKINTLGIITTVAGNGNITFNGDNIPAITATLDFPQAVAIDNAGNLLISDSLHYVIRKVDTAGVITTFAGIPDNPGFSGDGGSPSNAQFGDATNFGLGGIVISSSNIIYIADEGNNRIRSISSFCPINPITTLAQQDVLIESIKFKMLNVASTPNDGPIDINPNLGGGMRIFPDADSPGRDPKREVLVTIKLTQGVVKNVYIRSFDINDATGLFSMGSIGNDNQGPISRPNDSIAGVVIPIQGAFRKQEGGQVFVSTSTQPLVITTNECGIATLKFIVTMQPGDNFRICASTEPNILNGLSVNGQNVVNGNNILVEESSTSGSDVLMSKMLTVWRYLHVEIDSMMASPTSDIDPERNFVKGEIVKIEGSGKSARKLVFSSSTDILLGDKSPNLSGVPNPKPDQVDKGNGRFERGIITIGNGLRITDLDGNGDNFVEKTKGEGIVIPCSLLRDGMPVVTGNVVNIDTSSKNEKEISVNIDEKVKLTDYISGKIIIAGSEFTIVDTKGKSLNVIEEIRLPFVLIDDDLSTSPFLIQPNEGENAQANTPFSLMQTSDSSTANLFAPAYIKPIYDLSYGMAKFNRNVEDNPKRKVMEIDDLRDQVVSHHNVKSEDNFWVAYIQGGFQSTTYKKETKVVLGRVVTVVSGDFDPDLDVPKVSNLSADFALGITSSRISIIDQMKETFELKDVGGSIIFLEQIRESGSLGASCSQSELTQIVIVHEVGHQFGLTHPQVVDEPAGLMDVKGCKTLKKFNSNNLKQIRKVPKCQSLEF